MTITHHPSEQTLAAFALGTLDEARSLVVATHIERCPHCQRASQRFETLGGITLEESLPEAMSSDAVERTIARAVAPEPPRVAPANAAERTGPLAAYPAGPWRRIGPRIQLKRIEASAPDGTRVFMLKAAPGTVLPHHSHRGSEWTCILQGAFRHEHGRYGAGDFDEADESVDHHPVVEDGVECICVVALQGELRFNGFFGRLLQPFVRF